MKIYQWIYIRNVYFDSRGDIPKKNHSNIFCITQFAFPWRYTFLPFWWEIWKIMILESKKRKWCDFRNIYLFFNQKNCSITNYHSLMSYLFGIFDLWLFTFITNEFQFKTNFLKQSKLNYFSKYNWYLQKMRKARKFFF